MPLGCSDSRALGRRQQRTVWDGLWAERADVDRRLALLRSAPPREADEAAQLWQELQRLYSVYRSRSAPWGGRLRMQGMTHTRAGRCMACGQQRRCAAETACACRAMNVRALEAKAAERRAVKQAAVKAATK